MLQRNKCCRERNVAGFLPTKSHKSAVTIRQVIKWLASCVIKVFGREDKLYESVLKEICLSSSVCASLFHITSSLTDFPTFYVLSFLERMMFISSHDRNILNLGQLVIIAYYLYLSVCLFVCYSSFFPIYLYLLLRISNFQNIPKCLFFLGTTNIVRIPKCQTSKTHDGYDISVTICSRTIELSVCLSACLTVCFSVCLSICLQSLSS